MAKGLRGNTTAIKRRPCCSTFSLSPFLSFFLLRASYTRRVCAEGGSSVEESRAKFGGEKKKRKKNELNYERLTSACWFD